VGSWQGDILTIAAAEAAEFYITLMLDPTKAKPLPTAKNTLAIDRSTKQMGEQLRKLGLDRRTNYALKAKATSTGNKDGGAVGPQGAVDGSAKSYWDETNDRKSYSLILTLAKAHAVSAATLLGYEHHHFAPKDFELIVNGSTVKAVTDATYEDNLLMLEFPRTECHTLELKITSYYGQSPAVRELGLYDLDETPSPDKLPLIKKWTLEELAAAADMTSERTTQQGVQRGMIVFLKAGCVKCHPVAGQGARTGPDLSKVAETYKGRKLLQQIIEPSSEINKDFRTWQILTHDGRLVTGLIVDDDGTTLSLIPDLELPEKIVRVAKQDVEEKSPSDVSKMPLDALAILTRQEIFDLLAYLEAGGTTGQ
jgi:putative heme-binding domain-containing protein